jgi:hypothetical protein
MNFNVRKYGNRKRHQTAVTELNKPRIRRSPHNKTDVLTTALLRTEYTAHQGSEIKLAMTTGLTSTTKMRS